MYLFRQAGRLTWQIRWKRAGKVYSTSTGFTDRDDATRVLLAMRAAQDGRADERRLETLLRAAFAGRASSGLALADVAAEYREQSGVDGERASHVLGHWRQFCEWCKTRPGITTLADIDAATCRAFPAALSGSPKTIANRVGDCARVYRVVAPLHGLTGDPWRGMRLSHRTAPRRALTPAECADLVSATAGTEYGLAIVVGLYTGLRYRDIALLDWSDVGADEITLSPHKTRTHGITVRVPMHACIQDAMPPRGTGPVMPELAAGYGKRGDARRFMRACRAAGVPHDGITFHSLRHTFVTRLAEAGIPEGVRRRLAGHSNAVTHDRYTHDAQQQRAAIDSLPAIGAKRKTARRG